MNLPVFEDFSSRWALLDPLASLTSVGPTVLFWQLRRPVIHNPIFDRCAQLQQSFFPGYQVTSVDSIDEGSIIEVILVAFVG